MNEIQMVKVKKIRIENKNNKTFFLDRKIDAMPGQFFMVWLPGVNEKPFAVLNFGNQSAINVELKGNFSKKMFDLKVGSLLGLRGPFGKGFYFEDVKNACIVAGGHGVVPLLSLANALKENNARIEFILGAATGNQLLFEKELSRLSKLSICTDDGSKGLRCFSTVAFEKLLKKKKFDCVFTCGPEPMMLKVVELCRKKNIECQASFERFMKCGIGICGSCTLNGYRVCADGPVFDSKQIAQLSESGKFARLKSGKRVPLAEYISWRET